MKKLCFASFYGILGRNRAKTNCICEKLEMDYEDMFDLGQQYTDGVDLEEYREGLLEDCSNYYRSERKNTSYHKSEEVKEDKAVDMGASGNASGNVYGY
ncbi:MAG: hypothetical protein P8I93_08880 [Crocinitomicaceae bacterium]|nr:hypothetical protein [Crocinitomicaceae bacterium]